MLPYIFLSLSHDDERFVESVFRKLPMGMAFFYKKSFFSGDALLNAMEEGVRNSAIFALFASKRSLASYWVLFEIDNARLQSIKDAKYRVLVYPIEDGISVSDLPDWMQAFWVGNAGRSPQDVARHLRYYLEEPSLRFGNFQRQVIGRGKLLDEATRLYFEKSKFHPNIFMFAGLVGIGRRTFCDEFLKHVFSTNPSLARGPEIILPQFADLAELWRGLRDEIENERTPQEYEASWLAFNKLKDGDKIEEIANSISYFGNLNQAVRVVIGNGLFNDDGTLKYWVPLLFDRLRPLPCYVAFISNRQVHEIDLRDYENVLQFYVPPLDMQDIAALITATLTRLDLEPIQLDPIVVKSIGGHPSLAQAAVRLVKQNGRAILEKKPTYVFDIQREILSENIAYDSLDDIQKNILCILSWVPFISGELLFEIITYSGGIKEQDVADSLQDLILACLVVPSGEKYFISSPIRQLFRRSHGYGNEALLRSLGDVLKREWQRAERGERGTTADLVDTFVYMHALEGKSLPVNLEKLLPPAVLLNVVRDIYSRAREEADLYERVCEWGGVANNIRCDEGVREEILSYVVRAQARLRHTDAVDRLLETFDKRAYRSRHLLRGFSLRFRGKPRDAIPHLQVALETRKYFRSVLQELALCYRKTNDFAALERLLTEHKEAVHDSAFLLDFLIGLLISQGRFAEADAAIQELKYMPQNEGHAQRRSAQLLMREKRDYRGALEILDYAIRAGIGSESMSRATRAIAAAYSGEHEKALEDIEFVRTKMQDGGEIAKRLKAHYFLSSGDYSSALNELDSVRQETPMDGLLRARIFESEAQDIATPLEKREELQGKAEELRRTRRHGFDLDFDAFIFL